MSGDLDAWQLKPYDNHIWEPFMTQHSEPSYAVLRPAANYRGQCVYRSVYMRERICLTCNHRRFYIQRALCFHRSFHTVSPTENSVTWLGTLYSFGVERCTILWYQPLQLSFTTLTWTDNRGLNPSEYCAGPLWSFRVMSWSPVILQSNELVPCDPSEYRAGPLWSLR